jgi:hypothetical protein
MRRSRHSGRVPCAYRRGTTRLELPIQKEQSLDGSIETNGATPYNEHILSADQI